MTLVIKGTKYNSWADVNWAKVNGVINNLQRRIFVAKQQGRFRTLRKLQNLLLSSESNRLQAVRQICQVDSGKNTPRVDNKVFASPFERLQLVSLLGKTSLINWKPIPTKRIYISKRNGKLRLLKIPILADLALQEIVKCALEPEWEAVFEASSCGFRKFLCSNDAIRYIHDVCNSHTSKRWIVDADIKGFFENIPQEYLLGRLHSFPAQRLIKRWLQAGYLNKRLFHDSSVGTPQYGVISSLLANIAFHGMEEAIGISCNKFNSVKATHTLIRYGNDFIVACQTEQEARLVKSELNSWLKLRGLTLSTEKTRILHISDGFDFLGFNIKLYKSSSKDKLLIKPSKTSLVKFRYKLKTIWKKSLGSPLIKVVSRINPVIKRWSQYYKIGVSSKRFSSLDRYMWIRQYRYARRTHPKKSWDWIKSKYWSNFRPNTKNKDRLMFGCNETGAYMDKFSWASTKRHFIVKNTS
uniref:Putative reverse transcriptase/maturase n=1 Tax=Flintiella sanguinaria TaxID=101926 RepID=A0A1X9PUC6_9RHOD|nr:putative reverse transcriptase/maturase [Flintiella sanguinaria]